LEHALQERLEGLGGRVELGTELTQIRQRADGVVAVAGDREFHADWLIGCDGARSSVRKMVGLPLSGTAHAYDLVLADVILTWDDSAAPEWGSQSDHKQYIFMAPEGPFLVWRMPGRDAWRCGVLRRLQLR
jgi:2-polyprenyl-6-methoxyphenol hydroxylase-like FAD-dependent oxidoreductase